MNASPESLLFQWSPSSAEPEPEDTPLEFDPTGDLVAHVERAMAVLCEAAHGSPLHAMVQEHLGTGGKRLRAKLAVEASVGCGASYDAAIWWAAACELLHNATLVHDDLQDGDLVRRGRPALWARYGAAQAINAGDMLLMLAYRGLARMPVSNAQRAALTDCISRRTVETACGQARELDLTERGDPCWEGYLHAAMGKTGQFFAMPVEGALICAGHRPEVARRVGDTFAWVGVLFQIIDDVVDLYGLKGRGEPGADIREGKLSALVIQHLTRAPEDEAWLLGILRTPRDQTTRADIEAVRVRFGQSGAYDSTLEIVRRGRVFIETHPELQHLPELRALGLLVLEHTSSSIRHLLDDRPSLTLSSLHNA